MNNSTKYPCPQCNTTITYSSQNPFRPFCSERCQLIDLGKWANEEYSMPAQEPDHWTEENQPH